jgi:hypothetical protein
MPGSSEVGGVDTSGSNAGERLTDEQAAPPASPFTHLDRLRYHARIALLILKRAAAHPHSDYIDQPLELAEKALKEVLHRSRGGI